MRPYARQKLDERKKIFNYRLSRARHVIESAFGILVARWRIYRKPIISSLSLGRKIVQATCVLHNFIIDCEGTNKFYSTLNPSDSEVESAGIVNIQNKERSHCSDASKIRNTFAEYFEKDGAIPWQWEKALHNDF